MIICHPLKLIFIKTKKVGGTSFEIALSSFCDDSSIITPISPTDEDTRRGLGYPTAQNHEQQTWPDGTQTEAAFFNHLPASKVRAMVPQEIWDSYTKITICRDPYDAAISRYYWEKSLAAKMDFGQFLQQYPQVLTENSQIAPLQGADQLDVYLRYEHLEEDVKALGIDELWERFSSLRAKGALRPRTGADPATLYGQFPAAADVVEQYCAEEIEKFGYQRPVGLPAAAASAQPVDAEPQSGGHNDFIFTLSAGRTGTAWLAQFLGDNLKIKSVHEPLGVLDFGTKMPEISHMRRFNTLGMDAKMQQFWQNKLAGLSAPYAESNHTLGKCGLIEALADSPLADRSTVVILRRDLAKQCASYVGRNDFQNITIPWQWYLDMSYANVIVNPKMFRQLGQIGWAMWYALEMETRYAYYALKYSDRIHFVEARLEEATKPEGAARLLAELGHEGQAILPPKTNHTRNTSDVTDALTSEIRILLDRLSFDPLALASTYINSGKSLHMPAMSGVAAA